MNTSYTRILRLFAGLGAAAGFLNPALFAQTREAPDEEAISLSRFVVEQSKMSGYTATSAIGATRSNVVLMDIPQTVSVINRQFLEDTGATEMVDALKYISGVSHLPNFMDRVIIRGFLVQAPYTDGLPDVQTQGLMGADPFLLERVEVLKGPSAIVYGSHNPGGVINRVRKTPQFEQGGSIGVTLGNHEQRKIELDSSGPLGEGLAYRTVATYREEGLHGGRAVRFADAHRWMLSPMLTWRASDRVQVRFVGELMHEEHFKHWGENAMFRPHAAGGATSVGLLPDDFTFSDEQGRNDNDKHSMWLSLETELTDFWTLRIASTATWWDHYVIDLLPTGFNADNRNMPRLWRAISNDDFSFVNAVDQVIDFDLGPTSHELLIISQAQYRRGYASRVDDRNRPLLDIYNPVYGYIGPVDPRVTSDRTTRSDSWNISAQDHIRMLENRLQLVGGVRYDRFSTKTDNNLTGVEGGENRGNHTTYKFGVVYRPVADMSVYYNYAETFTPVFGANPDGQTYRPQEGIINEVGIKTSFQDGRFTAGLAAFQLENTNRLRPDPDPERASAGYRFQDAKIATEGVELDLVFTLTPQWELMASGAVLDFERPDGTVPESAHERTAALWTRYSFARGPLAGLTIGGGLDWKGPAPIEDSNFIIADDRTILDLFARYERGQYQVSLNVSNLTDVLYLNRAVNQNTIFYGPERLWKIKFTRNF